MRVGYRLLGVLALVATSAMGANRVAVEPRNLFIPMGFDDNDEVVVVADGYLPDPCHQLRDAQVQIDAATKKIAVTVMAVQVQGPCTDVTVPFQKVVSLGTLPAGEYSVVSGKITEKLPVKAATTVGRDERLYAPVESVDLSYQEGAEKRVALKGRFTDTCLVMGEIKVINTGRTIEILPIAKRMDRDPQGRGCERSERAFSSNVVLPELKAGRYLLHVRSMNGQSVNEVFTVW